MFKRSTFLRGVPSSLRLTLYQYGSVRMKLKYFIYANQLFIKDDVKTSADDTGQRHTKIAHSIRAKWHKYKDQYHDTILEIEFMKTGSALIDNRLADFELQLSTLINAECLTVKSKIKSVIYKFKIKESKESYQWVLTDNVELNTENRKIKLDKYHDWVLDEIASMGIFGTSGSGKSRLSYYIINQMMTVTDAHNIYICDPKSDELAIYCSQIFKLPNVADDYDTIKSYIEKTHEIMESRYSKRKNFANENNGKIMKYPPVFLVIDEVAALKLVNKKDFANSEDKLKSIALKGRACNVQLLLICQRPSVESLPSDIRDQLKIRVLLGNPANPETFKMALGESRDQNKILEKQRGEGYILVDGKNGIDNFKAPFISTEDEIEE